MSQTVSHPPKDAFNKRNAASSSTSPGRSRLRLLGLVPLAIAIGILLMRCPFLPTPLSGEEGCFGWLVVDNDRDVIETIEKTILIGRLNGRPVVSLTAHPIVPYAFLARVVRPMSGSLAFNGLSYKEKSAVARFPFLAIWSLAFVILLLACRWLFKPGSWIEIVLPCSLLAFMATSPMVVRGSVQPQVDGSWGVMLVALSGFFLLVAGRMSGPRRTFSAALLAGMVAAMGKNEWAMAFLAAAGTAALLVSVARRRTQGLPDKAPPHRGRLVSGAVIGVLLGSVVSVSLAPKCYLGGLHVMKSFGLNPPLSWPSAFLLRWPKIWPLFPLLLLSGWLLVRQWKDFVQGRLSLLLLFLWGLALVGGYLLTSWSGADRYFCPGAFAILLFSIMALRDSGFRPRFNVLLSVLFVLGICFHLAVLYHPWNAWDVKRDNLLPPKHRRQYQEFRKTGTPVVGGPAFGYYYPDADFISNSLSEEQIEGFVQRFGE